MALEAGIWFLVNIGYSGPVDDAAPVRPRVARVEQHNWPPLANTPETKQKHLLRHILGTVDRSGNDANAAGEDILRCLPRPDQEVADALDADLAGQVGKPFTATGVCIEPAVVSDDVLVEAPGSIGPGDLCAFLLRGQLVSLIKVFAGLVEHRDGSRGALFYLADPEGMIEADVGDILFARKLRAPRKVDGAALLLAAATEVTDVLASRVVPGMLEPTTMDRPEALKESFLSIVRLLRGQPE